MSTRQPDQTQAATLTANMAHNKIGLWNHEPASAANGPYEDCGLGLSDVELRAALAAAIPVAFAGMAVVVEEVECWRGFVRADYLCATSDGFTVIEIKSDRDSLRRFAEQVRVYSAIADRVLLVVGWNLAARALRAAPRWWDVILAEQDRDAPFGVRLVPLRDGAPNPAVALEALVAMLPMTDVLRLARAAGQPSTYRGVEARAFVSAHVAGDVIRAATREWLVSLSERRKEVRS